MQAAGASTNQTASLRPLYYTMSKGNMLLGHARGKVGSLVFSRQNGQQIVRSKADTVKNPRSQAQMIQRIILNTVAQAYSAMKNICNHSFEGVPVGEKSQAYFMKRNLDKVREMVATRIKAGDPLYEIVAFTELGANYFAPNNYEISRGTLPVIAVKSVEEAAFMGFDLPENSYQSIIDHYGLQRGDQLTFVVVDGRTVEDQRFNYARVILDPRDSQGHELPLATAFIADGKINMPSPRNEGEIKTLTFADGTVNFQFFGEFLSDAAIIVSRKEENGNWQRSNATLVANTEEVVGWCDLEFALEAAQGAEMGTKSRRYLNNAGTATLAGTLTGSKIVSLKAFAHNVARDGVIDAAGPDPTQAVSVPITAEVSNPTTGLMLAIAKNGSVLAGQTANVINGNANKTFTEATAGDFDGANVVLWDGANIVDTYCSISE